MAGREKVSLEQSEASDALIRNNGGLGRKQVSDIQRSRMLSAMREIASECGAGNVTVAHVVARAGVSRRTFYEVFEDCEDCFLAALEDGIARVAREVLPAYEGAEGWHERIRAGLVALLSVLDRDTSLARLLIVESLGGGPTALERRSDVLAQLTIVVDAGRGQARRGLEPTPLTAEGVVGAVLAVLHDRLRAGDRRQLIGLTNPLMAMIVLPYLGPAAARRESLRASPKPKSPTQSRASCEDPLRKLEMRLTYRTVRVLAAVGANPGSSNRVVGTGAEISDQGQISKLLARLSGLGLVENVGADGVRGAPNSWRLTRRGMEVHSAIVHETASA